MKLGGFGNNDILERVQLKFLKYILGLKASTPSAMVYGETGVFPLKVDIDTRVIKYWANIIQPTIHKITTKMYFHIHNLYINSNSERTTKNFSWLSNIKNILCKCGYHGIWLSHSFANNEWLTNAINLKLKDIFITEWYSETNHATSFKFYKTIKNSFGMEAYLSKDYNKNVKSFARFRTRHHRLPIETGRWSNITYENRKCNRCDITIGDEYHYIIECPFFRDTKTQICSC